MTDRHALADESANKKLPAWIQWMVALIGTALIAAPVAAVVWYL